MKKSILLGILLVGVVSTPAVAAQEVSDFEDGTMQGWAIADPLGTGFNGTLILNTSGGNPTGYLSANHTQASGDGTLLVKAPSALFTGDLSSRSLSWDVLVPRSFNTRTVTPTRVLLEGQDGTIYSTKRDALTDFPYGRWFSREIDFTNTLPPGGLDMPWEIVPGTGFASFEDVVTNVEALYIDLNARGVPVSPLELFSLEAGIDNIEMTTGIGIVVCDGSTLPQPANFDFFDAQFLSDRLLTWTRSPDSCENSFRIE